MAEATTDGAAAPPRSTWALAPRLRALIRRAGDPTYAEIAGRAGLNPQLVGRYARGVKTPRPATLARLLKAIGATERDLLAADLLADDLTPRGRGKLVPPGRLRADRRGEALRALAAARGATAASLAAACGMRKHAVARALASRTPRAATLERLRAALGATEAELAALLD